MTDLEESGRPARGVRLDDSVPVWEDAVEALSVAGQVHVSSLTAEDANPVLFSLTHLRLHMQAKKPEEGWKKKKNEERKKKQKKNGNDASK